MFTNVYTMSLELVIIVLILFVGSRLLAQEKNSCSNSWYDLTWNIDERVDTLLSAMTLREKISQMVVNNPAIPHLIIPNYNW